MSTITMAATVQPSNWPPRVKVDITDSGTPAISSVTVTRTDPQGNVSTVRTADGNPLTLVTSGSNRVGTVYDYEAPYQVPVTYSTVQQPASVSATVTVPESRTWLIHIGVPALSLPITIKALADQTRKVVRGVFYPLGRKNPVVVTDGQRRGREGTLSILTQSDDDRQNIEELIDDASVLLLNVPANNLWGFPASYVSFGDSTESRAITYLGEPIRYWSLPYTVVDSPVGGSQAQYTWADVIAKYPTWSALIAANPTWNDVIAPTS